MRLLVAVTVLSLSWLSKAQSDSSIVLPRNCNDLFDEGDKENGVRTVYTRKCDGCEKSPISVYCDQTSDGGGWTVIQHREALPLREDFFRGWTEYKLGFGNLTGEFWLGLENIHALVKDKLMELKVDLEDFEEEKRFARYDYFHISDALDNFRLEIGSYSGDSGDSLTYHNGMQFSTKDRDNDIDPDPPSCAEYYKGAWWYKKCLQSNLNGYPHAGENEHRDRGISWIQFRGGSYSLKETTMSIRPKYRH